jgi:hypothetical protein
MCLFVLYIFSCIKKIDDFETIIRVDSELNSIEESNINKKNM